MTEDIKCTCRHCDGHLSFAKEHVGTQIECPHCHQETTLFIPRDQRGTMATPAPKPSPQITPETVAAPRQAHEPVKAPKRIEDTLDTIGDMFFGCGILGAALCLLAILFAIESGNITVILSLIVGALVLAGQGYISRALFQGFAEVIRLLRAGKTKA